MKNALNNKVGMLGDIFLWLVANLKQKGIYFIKQACGNDILASVYMRKYGMCQDSSIKPESGKSFFYSCCNLQN